MHLLPIHDKQNCRAVIDLAVKTLKIPLENGIFNKLAGIGLSGHLVGPIIAYELDVPYIAIRKETDDSHSKSIFEGDVAESDKICLIDDFSIYGTTMKNAKAKVPQLNSIYFYLSPFQDQIEFDDWINLSPPLIPNIKLYKQLYSHPSKSHVLSDINYEEERRCQQQTN